MSKQIWAKTNWVKFGFFIEIFLVGKIVTKEKKEQQ